MRGRAATVKSAAARSRTLVWLVRALERVDRPKPNRLTVFTYHRLVPSGGGAAVTPGLVSATAAGFEEQIRFLGAKRPVVSLADLLAARREQSSLPPGAVMITFDDAYRDFADLAWPILRRYGMPVTLFVPTAYPDQPRAFWWDLLYGALRRSERRDTIDTPAGRLPLLTESDRDRVFRVMRDYVTSQPHDRAMATVDRMAEALEAPPPASEVLGWDVLRGLAREGVTLAPHSRTHPLLHRLPLDQARAEIVGSRDDLERELGEVPPAFAYPAGGHSDALVQVLAEERFEVAFTTARGANDLRRAEWLRVHRINVGSRSTLPVIRAQLLSSPLPSRAPRLQPGSR